MQTARQNIHGARSKHAQDSQKTGSYTKTGTIGLKGSAYQMKLTMLFIHRGFTMGAEFRIANEVWSAEKLDDVIYEYTENNEAFCRFVQVKHKEDETKTISIDDLMTEGAGDYALLKYFNNYRKMINSPEFSNVTVKDITIYTNVNFKFGDINNGLQLNDFFETSPDTDNIIDVACAKKKPQRYKIRKTFYGRENLCRMLKGASDIYRVARCLAQCILYSKPIQHHNKDSIFKYYHHVLAKDVIDIKNKKFYPDFLDDSKSEWYPHEINVFRKLFGDEMSKEIQFYSQLSDKKKRKKAILFCNPNPDAFKSLKAKHVILKLSKNFGEHDPEQRNFSVDCIKDDEIEDYLNKLVFAVDQPDEMELGQIVQKEVQEDCGLGRDYYNQLFILIFDWMKQNDGYFLSHDKIAEFYKKAMRGLSVWFDVRESVPLFTGRTKELEALHKAIQSRNEFTVISHSITGLGGIGKTELTRKYIQQYCQHYDRNVIWINAENFETMKESFTRLAKDKLNAIISDSEGKLKDIRSIIDDVYRYFAKKKCLFVFDNAERYKTVESKFGVDEFLPHLPNDANKPHIIITSRYQKWGHSKVLLLGVFTDNEAEEFIRNGLNLKDKEQTNDVEKLWKLLQKFPLALQQAVAYIKTVDSEVKCIDSSRSFKIVDYLSEFENKCKELLNFSFPDDVSDLYTKTTFTTWKMTIDKIISIEKFGSRAVDILNSMAYLAPDAIPTQMFLSMAENNERLLGTTVQTLKNYSMLNVEDGYMNVHRLVQQVIKINLREEGKEKEVICKAVDLLLDIIPCGEENLEEFKIQHKLLPHTEALLLNIDHFIKHDPSQRSEMEVNFVEMLLMFASNVYKTMGDIRKQKTYIECVLPILEEKYGPNSLQVVIMQENLFVACCNLGIELPHANKIHEKALYLLNREGCRDARFAGVLVSVGVTYGGMGDFHTQRKLTEMALQIYQDVYGPDHIRIANILINLSVNAYNTENYIEGQKLLDRALCISEKAYGPEHFEIGKIFRKYGEFYGQMGEYQKQKDMMEKSLNILQKHFKNDNFEVAFSLCFLGMAYSALDNNLKAKELLEKSLSMMHRLFGEEHPEAIVTLERIGLVISKLGDLEKAESIFEEVYSLARKRFGEDHEQTGKHCGGLGAHFYVLKNYPKAKFFIEESIRIFNKQNIVNYFALVQSLAFLGNIHKDMGDPTKAVKFLQDALIIIEARYPMCTSMLVQVLLSLGDSYGKLGDFPKAEQYFDRLVNVKETRFGTNHIDTGRSLVLLGRHYCAINQFSKAKKLIKRGRDIVERELGADHSETLMSYVALGIVYGFLNKPKKRIAALEYALPLLGNSHDIKNSEIVKVMQILSSAYSMEGRQDKAFELLSQAAQMFKNASNQMIRK